MGRHWSKILRWLANMNNIYKMSGLLACGAPKRKQGSQGGEGADTEACKLTLAHAHTLWHAPSIQALWCSMQHLSGKKTDKSKWTYCRIRWWRSFDTGPPNSHWDTWWRENKTQRGRVKDTERRRGIRQEERNIKTGREAGTREGAGGRGKGGKEQRYEGLENSTIHQLQRKRDDPHTVTSLLRLRHHHSHGGGHVMVVQEVGRVKGVSLRPLSHTHTQTQMRMRCTRTNTRTVACFAATS